MHPGTTNSGKQVKTALFEANAKDDKDVVLSVSKIERPNHANDKSRERLRKR